MPDRLLTFATLMSLLVVLLGQETTAAQQKASKLSGECGAAPSFVESRAEYAVWCTRLREDRVRKDRARIERTIEIRRELRKVAGPQAIDCGAAQIDDLNACVRNAFRAKKPFLVVTEKVHIDSMTYGGIASRPDGTLYIQATGELRPAVTPAAKSGSLCLWPELRNVNNKFRFVCNKRRTTRAPN